MPVFAKRFTGQQKHSIAGWRRSLRRGLWGGGGVGGHFGCWSSGFHFRFRNRILFLGLFARGGAVAGTGIFRIGEPAAATASTAAAASVLIAPIILRAGLGRLHWRSFSVNNGGGDYGLWF